MSLRTHAPASRSAPHWRSIVWIGTIVMGLHTAGAAHADGPFLEITFDQALARAKKENKLIFIDFYTTWCGPCKMLDKRTWVEKDVIAWLTEKTIALKIDAEKQKRLAEEYRVTGYPTLIFLRSDRTELDRLVGFHSPEEFLQAAEGIASGKDSLTRAREELEKAGRNDPMARQKYAAQLRRAGRYEEALQEYLWCFDEGNRHSLGFSGVRLSFLLREIVDLGRDYPPALEALRKRRDAIRARIVTGQAADLEYLDFTSLNDALGATDDSISLYDQLKREKPDSGTTTWFRELIVEELTKRRRYADVAEGIDLQTKIDERFDMYKPNWLSSLLNLKYTPEVRKEIQDAQLHTLAQEVGQYYQVLIGLKRFEEADALAERLLKVHACAQVYNTLAWNGYLTGAPTEANLEQARKAHEMTGENDVAIIDTLARILNARGQRDEAVTLVKDAMQRHTAPRDQKVLAQCLTDFGSAGRAQRLPARSWPYAAAGAALFAVILLVLLARRRPPRPVPAAAAALSDAASLSPQGTLESRSTPSGAPDV